jgi:hypothetical protein
VGKICEKTRSLLPHRWTGTATTGKWREKPINSRFPSTTPPPEPASGDKPPPLTAKLAFYPVSESSSTGATGEVRPEDWPKAANSAFSDVFGKCAVESGDFF